MTDEGLMHLSALSGLTRLVATPLGIQVTKGGIARLITALPSLKALDVGLNHVGQVGRGGLEVWRYVHMEVCLPIQFFSCRI